MQDSELFSGRYKCSMRDKPRKKLLCGAHQTRCLHEARKIARKLKRNRHIKNVWLTGSCLRKELGKYEHGSGVWAYSDIDLFVLLKRRKKSFRTHRQLRKLGICKRLVDHPTEDRRVWLWYYGKEPVRLMDRFYVTVWLMDEKSMREELKDIPQLLDGAERI